MLDTVRHQHYQIPTILRHIIGTVIVLTTFPYLGNEAWFSRDLIQTKRIPLHYSITRRNSSILAIVAVPFVLFCCCCRQIPFADTGTSCRRMRRFGRNGIYKLMWLGGQASRDGGKLDKASIDQHCSVGDHLTVQVDGVFGKLKKVLVVEWKDLLCVGKDTKVELE